LVPRTTFSVASQNIAVAATIRLAGWASSRVVMKELDSNAAARRLELALKRKKNPELAIFALQSHR
jgi:hypothetical protein